MRDIKINGEVRTVCSETTSTSNSNNLHRVMLVFDDSVLNVALWGAYPDGDSIQELSGDPLKPNCFNKQWHGIATLKSGRELSVTYWLITLGAFDEMENVKKRDAMATASMMRAFHGKYDLMEQSNIVDEMAKSDQAKAQAIKQLAAAPEARKPIEPSIKPKPLVTFSEHFLTVMCSTWPKSESRARRRQANTIIQRLFKNWRDNHNRPISVCNLLKGQTIDRLDKALNATTYPRTWSLIVTHAEEKGGKKTAMLSDSYDYRAL